MLNFAIVVDKPIRHSPLVVDKAHQLGCLIYAYKFFASTTRVTLQYQLSETPVPVKKNSSTSQSVLKVVL